MAVQKVISPLKKKIILVKYKMNFSNGVQDKKHVVYGGMMENATDTIYGPAVDPHTNVYRDPLTNEERKYFAYTLQIPEARLDPYYKGAEGVYWDDFVIRLDKSGIKLDLNEKLDYLKWRVLQTYRQLIAPSYEEREKKASYKYYMIDETSVAQSNTMEGNAKTQAYTTLSKISDDVPALKYVVKELFGKSVAKDTKPGILLGMIYPDLDTKIKRFNKLTDDKLFNHKVLLTKAVSLGVVNLVKGEYINAEDGKGLCDSGKATLDIAAAYIASPANQGVKLEIEERIKVAE